MEHLLAYENIDWENHYDNYIEPLINHQVYGCEEDGCEARATIEWMCRSEEGDIYYTMRCDSHPAKRTDYEPREL